MNIIEAIHDPNLLRPFLAESQEELESWERWMTALRVLYGIEISEAEREQLEFCTGTRSWSFVAKCEFQTALFLVGRRSGKSRIAAVVGAYEASLANRDTLLHRGEKGLVAILAPTRRQASIVKDYLRSIFEVPLLKQLVVKETFEGIELSNNIRIEVLTGDWRSVRGFTLIAAIVDEAAFFGISEESKVRSDTELIRALQPGLATTGGKLIAISSPYARKGWTYKQYQRNYGNPDARTLVWNCESRYMNPTLPREVVDQALEEDRASALAEYMGQFRDDVAEYLPRSTIQAVVVDGRTKLMPNLGNQYSAFVDMSGGRHDDAALAIGHKGNDKAVVDFQMRWKAPFDPSEVIEMMAVRLKEYRVGRVVGDNYSGEFAVEGFRRFGITYVKAKKNKNELYADFLPWLCSRQVELLDDELMISQLAALERRTRSGGKDVIDHPQGGKDDLANAVAGVVTHLYSKTRRAGGPSYANTPRTICSL